MKRNMINSLALVLSIFILLSLSVHAQAFSVNVNAINNTIKQNQVASFKITITNGREPIHVRIVPINEPSKWASVYTDPAYPYLSGLNLAPNETKSFTLFVKPQPTIRPSNYALLLTFKGDSGFVVQKIITLQVNPFTPSVEDYDTYLTMNVNAPQNIDPRIDSKIVVSLRNKVNFPLLALKLKVNSSLLNTERITSVDANGNTNEVFIINISPKTKPQSGLFKIQLLSPANELIKEFDSPYSVIPYIDFRENKTLEKGFLKSKVVLSVRNFGNSEGKGSISYRTNWFKAWFTHSNPKGTLKHLSSGSVLSWTFTLKPNEQKVVVITENYVPLFLIVLLLLLAYAFYYFVIRNPIVIKKEARIIKLKEGGISELKVFIHIKNRSAKVFENVVLLDKLPKIAEIDKTIETGTLKPSKIIRHSVKGTVIKWEVGTLDRFEERIINYTIKSKLSILGWFKLPSAAVKFRHNGKLYITKSNSIRLEVPKPEEK